MDVRRHGDKEAVSVKVANASVVRSMSVLCFWSAIGMSFTELPDLGLDIHQQITTVDVQIHKALGWKSIVEKTHQSPDS